MPLLPPMRALPGALLLSLAAHGLAVGLVVKTVQEHKPAASMGRNKGSLLVTLRREAAVAAKPAAPAPDRNAAAATPRKQRLRTERAERPAPAPKAAAAPVATAPVTAPAAAATEPPPAERPGARFASLFAPVVHAPIGQGGWASNRPRAAAAPSLSAEQQRAQAMMALRAALQGRFADLAEQLRAAEAQLACDLVIDIERRIGQLDCGDPAQQAMAWGHLQGTLVAGVVAEATQRLCLRLSGGQVQDTACPSSATP